MTPDKGPLLFEGAEWDFDTLRRIHDACEEIAVGELGLAPYPSRIEVISAEQMLDAYAANGMPMLYRHWSFGKRFAREEALYRKGFRGLAYEIVINSKPCIAYLMEENTATMQALVIAHAAFGHSHFFRNNHVFRDWTDAAGILDYLEFAKRFVAECEEKHSVMAVERILDAAHALSSVGVFRTPPRRLRSLAQEEQRTQERREKASLAYNVLWSTVPGNTELPLAPTEVERRLSLLQLPQENVLYFLEKHAPNLKGWQRELLRIARTIAQYFYPQMQTKLMNEGCATYVHHRVMTRLWEQGRLSDGNYLEFLHSHTSVVHQPAFDDRNYGGINPYALGYAMMCDIERIVVDPTAEDREWFPTIAGTGNPMAVLRDVWANYRDESFVLQFLSPKLMREFRLFHLVDDSEKPQLTVEAVHDERGYRRVRQALARDYDPAWREPHIEVVDVDLVGDRTLQLAHRVTQGRKLEEKEVEMVLKHLATLWGYEVSLTEIAEDGSTLEEHIEEPPQL